MPCLRMTSRLSATLSAVVLLTVVGCGGGGGGGGASSTPTPSPGPTTPTPPQPPSPPSTALLFSQTEIEKTFGDAAFASLATGGSGSGALTYVSANPAV